MRDSLLDLRLALRRLVRAPGFSLVAVLTLALGIGANTAIFSVVHAVLIRPLPFPQAERLVMVWEHNVPRSRQENVVSPINYLDWKERNEVFEDMAALFSRGATITGDGGAERVQAALVTANFFDVLRLQAALGRTFLEEDVEGGEDVVVLSHGFWQRRFGGDPGIVGSQVTLDGITHTVIGVMPDGFQGLRFEPQISAMRAALLAPRDFWVPMSTAGWDRDNTGRFLAVLARMGPGITLERAQDDMAVIARQLEEEYEYDAGWSTTVVPLSEQLAGDSRTALLILLGAVGFVLLIACANIGNLMLARASARQREMAVQSAVGAGRWRLIRQLLTESLVLAAVGASAGLAVAVWGVEALVAMSPGDLPRLQEAGLSWQVLSFALGVTVLAALLFGLVPAFQTSRPDLQQDLKEGGWGASPTAGRRARRVLVVAQMALAVVLLIGAGLLVRSFWELRRVDPGFAAENALSATITLPSRAYPEESDRVGFFQELLRRLEGAPGVSSASAIVARPLGGGLAPATSFRPIDRPEPEAGEWPVADVRMVMPGYFRTMGIPLLRGRDFDSRDGGDTPPVVLVNRTLAETFWPGADPVGERLIVNMGDDTPREIVGVVGDVRHGGLAAAPRPKVYYPYTQLNWGLMDVVIRGSADVATLSRALQREVAELDPNIAVYSIKTMGDVVAESVAEERFNTALLLAFAVLALVLASLGIYGVMAYSVARRSHELGVRMALGARSRRVLTLVIREGLQLAGVGLALGIAAAFGLTRLLSSLLFEVGTVDPLTFAVVPVVLLLSALLASYVPALRAARVDPATALRYE